jgi:hypothetical protein
MAPSTANLDKIYNECGQWIRMANTIIWGTGAFLVSLSLSCIGLAVNHPAGVQYSVYRIIALALASVFLFLFWMYISYIYRRSAFIAREVLMNIETEWDVDPKVALYKLTGQVGKTWFGLFNLQKVAVGVLLLIWLFLIISNLANSYLPRI